MTTATLTLDIKTYWHPGGGRGGGFVVDALAHRDSNGLPTLPGRHLKGLLREAVEFAENLHWSGYAYLPQMLFGERTKNALNATPTSGCLRISDATLPNEVGTWLASEAGRALIPNLYRKLYATAVDQVSGAAVDRSLRGIEVVVPVTLQARIDPIIGREAPPEAWLDRLKQILPLIDAVGAHRTRGLGRAVLSLEECT